MNRKAIKDTVNQLQETSNPAYGLSKLILDEVLNIECGMKPRLTNTELSHVANSLALLCQSVDRSASYLYEELEEQEETSQ